MSRGIDFVKEKKTGFTFGTGPTTYYWKGKEVTEFEYYRLERQRDFVKCKCGISYHKALRCPKCCIQPNLSDIAIALDKISEKIEESFMQQVQTFDEIKTLLVRYDMVPSEGGYDSQSDSEMKKVPKGYLLCRECKISWNPKQWCSSSCPSCGKAGEVSNGNQKEEKKEKEGNKDGEKNGAADETNQGGHG